MAFEPCIAIAAYFPQKGIPCLGSTGGDDSGEHEVLVATARFLGAARRPGHTGLASQPPGGRYDECILTPASTSAGVKRATVRTCATTGGHGEYCARGRCGIRVLDDQVSVIVAEGEIERLDLASHGLCRGGHTAREPNRPRP